MADAETRVGSWIELGALAWAVRRRVFGDEQGVPEELDGDGEDGRCVHVVLLHGGEPVATGRVTPEGKVGRVAVLRRSGLGAAVMAALEAAARERGIATLTLHAQRDAIPFYERLGYAASGPELAEADIPHRRMELRLAQ